jgi:fermentation-respiration switch protein FrsA (DUF1100 family)
MKKIIGLFWVLMFPFLLQAQDITGQWNGILKVQGMQLRLVFHIIKTDTGYSSTMDSPDQGAKDLKVTATSFENLTLKLEVKYAGIEYSGVMSSDQEFLGTFKQGGKEFPLALTRAIPEKTAVSRPQEPKAPFPYKSENIVFDNPVAGNKLSGTITIPEGKNACPAVILISGSGAQDRNESLFDHKPFLVIADYLSRNGIIVLRYDDRGTAESTGNFLTATSADLATDAEAAVAYLKGRKDLPINKIGLAGHSEGGLIAPMIASKPGLADFIILLAGPGMQGNDLLLLQQKVIMKASGMNEDKIEKNLEETQKAYDIIVNTPDFEKLKKDLKAYLEEKVKANSAEIPSGMKVEDVVEMQYSQMISPWIVYFLRYNPVPALEKVTCPVLAINGEKDLQVPPKENLDLIKKALEKAGNNHFVVKELSGMNHLFQECKTGLMNEYGTIEQTFSPVALREMLQFIQNLK